VALIRLKAGLASTKLDEVMMRVPRSEVASVEMGGGFSSALTIELQDGSTWLLEVPRVSKKDAEKLVGELGG
jgi:hypothetical protein